MREPIGVRGEGGFAWPGCAAPPRSVLQHRCALCPPTVLGGEPSGKVGAQHQSTPRSLPLPLQGPPAAPWLRCPQPRLTRLAVDLCLSAHNQVD